VLEGIRGKKIKLSVDICCGFYLFAATAVVVWWQNTRLTVLYDLCGVLEHAARIAQGDLPYRDFPFPYAPLTFLTQAAVIELTGAVYWHHIAYCCIVAGLSTVVLWRIIASIVRDHLARPKLTAFVLAFPATVVGIYCIFPHPFYDPDAAFVILLCTWWALALERKGFSPVQTFMLGALCVVTLFVKQNIGLAFLGSIGLFILVRIAIALRRKCSVRPHLHFLGGLAASFTLALAIIHFTFGLDNYKLWTITYATARRTPSVADMLSVYNDRMLFVFPVLFVLGALLLRKYSEGKIFNLVHGLIAMAIPFLWPVIYLVVTPDSSERAERLDNLWPFVFIVLVASVVFVRKLSAIGVMLMFVILATAHGVFLSQQLWGSTYGIWPLLMILIATLIRTLFDTENSQVRFAGIILAVAISVSISIAGAFYIYSNERLSYVSFEDGDMRHSSLPQLQGLSMRGDFIPDFEELVKYTDENIPREDGILLLPGEDLFYYTTGRHPKFPVLLFDVTNNPYNAEEIRDRVLRGGIEWIVVKNDLQIEADQTIDDKDKIFELLKPDFRNIESLNNYEIYKRRHPGDPLEEEDDSDDDSDNSDDDPGN